MTATTETTQISRTTSSPFGDAVFTCPLSGVTLVEASAGTGKTFQIQTLFLRLVVQEGLTVDRMLVVTFTEAATKELRDRLRRILVKARGHLDGTPLSAEDVDYPRITTILGGALSHHDGEDVAAARLQRIRAAVRDFDQAAIFTIHGFCSRVLGEAAFECGLPFDTELAQNDQGMLTQVVQDEFRTRVYAIPPLLAAAAGAELSFTTIRKLVKTAAGKPDIVVEPAIKDATGDLDTVLGALQDEITDHGDMIAGLITAALETEFSGSPTIAEFTADWARFSQDLTAGVDSPHLVEFLGRFSTDRFEKDTKRKAPATWPNPPPLQAIIDAATAFRTWCKTHGVSALGKKWRIASASTTTTADVAAAVAGLLTSVQASATAVQDFVAQNSGKLYSSGKTLLARLATLQKMADETPDAVHPKNLMDTLNYFTLNQITNIKNKEDVHWQLPPVIARFANLCDDVLEQLDRETTKLKCELIEGCRERFRALKSTQNLRTFDDMLLDLRAALDPLQSPGADRLAGMLRDKFDVAVIDEFQDTDPVQYAIFSRIFIDGDKPLFLVGDPKQAIYAFRNGDIFTYFQAKGQVAADSRYTLLQNFRSEQALIAAVNHLFREPDHGANGGMSRSFAMPADWIRYDASHGADKNPEECLHVNGEPDPAPFKLQLLDPVGGKGLAREVVHEQVADDIDFLLRREQVTLPDHRADGTLARRPVRPGDIAVLVTAHVQARGLKEKLLARRIPAVLQSAGELFDSTEAQDMRLVLEAIADPRDFQSIRAALASPLFAMDGARVAQFPDTPLTNSDQPWPTDMNILDAFQAAHKAWDRGSFTSAFNTLATRTGMRQHLLSLANGERAVTNVLHVAEVLQQVSRERKLGIAGLTTWLHQQLDSASRDPGGETEIRLESDENAVKIMTVFKAKGLEFPIVFAPYMWEKSVLISPGKGKAVTYHRERSTPDAGYDLILDLEPFRPLSDGDDQAVDTEEDSPPAAAPPTPAQIAEDEKLAEHLRLLYVALTRGVHRSYLICGQFGEDASQQNALNYLLTTVSAAPAGTRAIDLTQANALADAISQSADAWPDPEATPFPIALLDATDKTTGAKPDDEQSPASLPVAHQPADATTPPLLAPRVLECSVDKSWAILSFSSLSPDYEREQETFDDEELDRDRDADDDNTAGNDRIPGGNDDNDSDGGEPTTAVQLPIFSFPGGRKVGNCWHAIFENLDFEAPATVIEAEARAQSVSFGIVTGGSRKERETKHQAIREMVRNVLRAPLPTYPDRPDAADTFHLSGITWAHRVAELQFMFRLPEAGLRTTKLTAVLAEHWDRYDQFKDALDSWDRTQWAGLLTGFVDLVVHHAAADRYYILDWKSNILDGSLASFTDERITEEMKTHSYFLQYLFYSVALHQYLSRTVPGYDYDSHFGGVFYLFLRGIDGRTGRGIYADRVSRTLIEALSAQLGAFANDPEGAP